MTWLTESSVNVVIVYLQSTVYMTHHTVSHHCILCLTVLVDDTCSVPMHGNGCLCRVAGRETSGQTQVKPLSHSNVARSSSQAEEDGEKIILLCFYCAQNQLTHPVYSTGFHGDAEQIHGSAEPNASCSGLSREQSSL